MSLPMPPGKKACTILSHFRKLFKSFCFSYFVNKWEVLAHYVLTEKIAWDFTMKEMNVAMFPHDPY